jgi:chromosome segregation ATPase
MGTRARDFRGNEIYDIERTDDLDDKLSMIEEALSKAEGERDWAEAEYSGWQDNVSELETLRDNVQSDIDAQEDDVEECRNCYDPAVINGLCGDCNKNEESKQPEEGTLAYHMQYRLD